MPVCVLKLEDPLATLRKALELCGGLEKLRPGDRILLKPNIGVSEWMPPFGMVTTTALLEALVRLLHERGCRRISIGEGNVDVFGLTMRRGFRRLQIDRLARRYGVELLDLNRGPFRTVELDGHAVQIAQAAFEHDLLVNVPALKTHNQVKASLGFKNLKGVLSPASKIKFHGTRRLDHLIRLLNETVRPGLTVVDGTYALEKGPDTVLGDAHRMNLVVAGTDPFAVDVVAASLLGLDAAEVGYLKEYAGAHALPTDLDSIEVAGERDVRSLARKLPWKADVVDEIVTPAGAKGLTVPHPGETLCSRCYASLGYSMIALVGDHPGADFGGAAICCGKEATPGDADTVVLYGDCAARKNASAEGAHRIAGCPPPLLDSVFGLGKALRGTSGMFPSMPGRLIKLGGMKLGLHAGGLAKWKRYESEDFDWGHFRASRT